MSHGSHVKLRARESPMLVGTRGTSVAGQTFSRTMGSRGRRSYGGILQELRGLSAQNPLPICLTAKSGRLSPETAGKKGVLCRPRGRSQAGSGQKQWKGNVGEQNTRRSFSSFKENGNPVRAKSQHRYNNRIKVTEHRGWRTGANYCYLVICL